MEGVRARAASLVEWLVAAAVIAVVYGAASYVAGRLRLVDAVMPVIAREAPAPVPPMPIAVPSGAVSVPVLLLRDGKSVRVGDGLSEIASRLGRRAEVGRQVVEPTTRGESLTRFYEHGGTRFVLVFESLASSDEPGVVAIYLQ